MAYLHTDKRLMPHKKRAWSSWNSVSDGEKTCITYWLNKLQNLDTSKEYFLTLNPICKINENSVIKKVDFLVAENKVTTLKLLNKLKLGRKKIFTYSDHSTAADRNNIISQFDKGISGGLISDAGTPLISDPGFKLVSDLILNNVNIISLSRAYCSYNCVGRKRIAYR